MLKIKDNVDLKELEKFGFKHTYYYNSKVSYWHYKINLNNNKDYEEILVLKSKEVLIYISTDFIDDYISDEITHILFDLIQAGLVEKVVE